MLTPDRPKVSYVSITALTEVIRSVVAVVICVEAAHARPVALTTTRANPIGADVTSQNDDIDVRERSEEFHSRVSRRAFMKAGGAGVLTGAVAASVLFEEST